MKGLTRYLAGIAEVMRFLCFVAGLVYVLTLCNSINMRPAPAAPMPTYHAPHVSGVNPQG